MSVINHKFCKVFIFSPFCDTLQALDLTHYKTILILSNTIRILVTYISYYLNQDSYVHKNKPQNCLLSQPQVPEFRKYTKPLFTNHNTSYKLLNQTTLWLTIFCTVATGYLLGSDHNRSKPLCTIPNGLKLYSFSEKEFKVS